jgi:hypothetical protein
MWGTARPGLAVNLSLLITPIIPKDKIEYNTLNKGKRKT